MKHILILLSLFISTLAVAKEKNAKEQPMETPAADCVVTLSSSNCNSSSPNILECYNVTWNGGNESWFIYVKQAPYGVSEGYNISYSKNGKSGLVPAEKTFETKKEAISNFVKTVVGSSCKYVYE